MDAIAPSDDDVAVLRAIARAGFSYEQTKTLGAAAGWKLVDDEFELGYVAFEMRLGSGNDASSRFAVEVRECGRPPRAFVPLFYFDDYDVRREPFDRAYRSLSEQLLRIVGSPSLSGEYSYAHRKNWLYSYNWWSLPDATLVLVQDEFDIQFGMDVSLWVLPAGAAAKLPVSGP
jgi:hypothetical protein